MENLKCGAAEVNITPPVGIDMTGFGGRKSGAVGIHDDLFAKALVLDDGETRLAIVTTDLLGLDDDVVADVRDMVQTQTAIPAGNVMLSSSHTHSGPASISLGGLGCRDESYVRILKRKLAGAVKLAAASTREVGIGFRRQAVCCGVNRRETRSDGAIVLGHNPKGKLAPYADIMRVDDAGRNLLAVLFHHAAHPVALGSDNLLISADFPGYAMRALKKIKGEHVVAMFAQGCCGNINCKLRGSFDEAECLGNMLAGAVLQALEEIETEPRPVRLNCVSDVVQLPLQSPPPVREVEATFEQAREALRAVESNPNAGRGQLYVARRLFEWAGELLALAKEGDKPRTRPFEIQVMAVGDAAFVALPGEVFVEYQLNIERDSPFAHTFVLGYTNGVIGYVPDASAFPKGGYEVETAHKYYKGTLMITPACEEIILDAARRLLRDVG